MGGEERHRDQPAPQPPLPGVLEHDVAVGHDVGTADLVHALRPRRQVAGREHVGDEVVDGDRLGAHVHPPRTDHHGQALHERAHHLVGEAAGSDDDGRAQLHDGDPARPEHVPGLLPAAEVLRQLGLVRRPQAAEVDDPAHARRVGRLPEVTGGGLVQGREARGRSPWSGRGSRPCRRRTGPRAGSRDRGSRPSRPRSRRPRARRAPRAAGPGSAGAPRFARERRGAARPRSPWRPSPGSGRPGSFAWARGAPRCDPGQAGSARPP